MFAEALKRGQQVRAGGLVAGHDAFLLDDPRYHRLVAAYFNRIAAQVPLFTTDSSGTPTLWNDVAGTPSIVPPLSTSIIG